MRTMSNILAQRIRIAAATAGLNMTQLGRRINLSQQSMSKIATGTTKDPHCSVIRAIALETGVTTDWLLGVEQAQDVAEASGRG